MGRFGGLLRGWKVRDGGGGWGRSCGRFVGRVYRAIVDLLDRGEALPEGNPILRTQERGTFTGGFNVVVHELIEEVGDTVESGNGIVIITVDVLPGRNALEIGVGVLDSLAAAVVPLGIANGGGQ